MLTSAKFGGLITKSYIFWSCICVYTHVPNFVFRGGGGNCTLAHTGKTGLRGAHPDWG